MGQTRDDLNVLNPRYAGRYLRSARRRGVQTSDGYDMIAQANGMQRGDYPLFFLFIANFAIALAMPVNAHGQWVVERSGPAVSGFFEKYVDCGGIAVRSSSAVDDEALRLACEKISLMLRHIPQARKALVRRGAELHIIGRDEQTSDLPEFKSRRGILYVDNRGRLTTIDQRARGMGGLFSSCGEENILHLAGDRYGDGSDVCVHEFAHAIMDHGIEPQQRQQINEQYETAKSAGLWENAYAATNAKEYWAELSMWYFGSHGARRHMIAPPAGDGPEALRSYDPRGFDLLQNIYGGVR